MGLGELVVLTPDELDGAHLPRKVSVTEWCRSPENFKSLTWETEGKKWRKDEYKPRRRYLDEKWRATRMFTWCIYFLQNEDRWSLWFAQECQNDLTCQGSLMQHWKQNLWNKDKGGGRICRLAQSKEITSKDKQNCAQPYLFSVEHNFGFPTFYLVERGRKTSPSSLTDQRPAHFWKCPRGWTLCGEMFAAALCNRRCIGTALANYSWTINNV